MDTDKKYALRDHREIASAKSKYRFFRCSGNTHRGVCFGSVAANFSKIDHPGMKQLGKVFGKAGPGLWEEIKEKEPSVTRSQIAVGLEQGLRDLSLIVAGQPPKIRSAAISAFRDAVQAEYPDFLERDKQRLAKVLGRGHIRTENEWYLLQHRLDEVEGHVQHQEETEILWELLDKYIG